MVAFNKLNLFTQQLVRGQHNMNGDTLKLALIQASGAPVPTDSTYSDVSADEVPNGNGYVTGGNSITSTEANVAGTDTVRSTGPVPLWTAAAAGFSFRYPTAYNFTDPANGLIGFWDYGSTLVLNGGAGDTFAALGFDTSIFTVT